MSWADGRHGTLTPVDANFIGVASPLAPLASRERTSDGRQAAGVTGGIGFWQIERFRTMSMLQPAPASPPPAMPAAATGGKTLSDDPLIRFAGSVVGSHALIMAANGPDLLCDLLRHGCAAATSVRLAERVAHESYDLVIVPRMVAPEQVSWLVAQARRALGPAGRFLAFVPAASARHGHDTGAQAIDALLLRSLRLGGFVAVRVKRLANGSLVGADLPMHAWSGEAPRVTARQA